MTHPELDLLTCPLDGTRLIEASAGTGKTWHIGGLWLRLLLERGLEVQQILVVTFTNAATAELRERLRARLVETLSVLRGGMGMGTSTADDAFVPALLQHLRTHHGLDDATLAQRLALALQGFDEAAIFTIHGWCQRALAEAPLAGGLPAAHTVLPDDSVLLLQAVNDFWRRHVGGDTLDPLLAAWLAGRGDTPQRWAALLARRLARPLSPCLWPAALSAGDSQPLPLQALAQAYAAARERWLTDGATVEQALREAAPRLHAAYYGAQPVAAALAGWQRWMLSGDALTPLEPQDGKLALLAADTLARHTRKGAAPPPHPFFPLAQALLAARRDVERALELQRLRLLQRLFDEAGAALHRRKRELHVLAYDDMLAQLHGQLLAAPALAEALRARWPAALIDEFQDTDPLQWAIVERVWGGSARPLLLVGDPKQAIYAFRNADLPTYLRARRSAAAVYSLARNQRASPALVAALNALFQVHARSFLLPGLDYAPAAVGGKPRPAFVDHSPAGGDTVALQLWHLPRDGQGRPLLREHALRASVRATAAEIARLLREGRAGRITLDGRPLQGGDVAVLVRTHAQAALVRQALAALGVGSVALSQASVFHTPQAEELQRLLAAVLEPQRPGLLRAALSTVLMGLDAAALAALAQDEAALDAHRERLAGWRACWLAHGIAALLQRWRQEAGVAQRLLARPDGARSLANLLHLGERLHEAEAQTSSPRALLRWLAQRRQQPVVDEADQLRLESDQQLVRIATIHKAKGLEYGLVFCPLLWDAQAVPASDGGMVQTHDDQGRPVLDLRAGLDADVDAPALRRRARLEQAAETLRLAYVALTRAVHRCYLVVGPYATRSGRGLSTRAGTQAWLNWFVAGEGFDDAAQWLQRPLGPQDIEAAWRRLAEGCPAIRLALLPVDVGEPLPVPVPQALEALAPPRHIAPGWRVAACGELAGDALRAALARADFADPASWDAAAWAALREHPLPGLWGAGSEARERMLADMLRRLLQDVADTEIAPGLRLRQLAPGRCLRAVEFHLPADVLTPEEAQALAGAPVQALKLQSQAPASYLCGVMDLVFEHAGRYWVLGWQPDVLGTAPLDYAGEALARAASAHEPALRLQALALQRWLERRVPGYDHDAHFGGALLLFVRGVRPGWRQPDGVACGVWHCGHHAANP